MPEVECMGRLGGVALARMHVGAFDISRHQDTIVCIPLLNCILILYS